MPNAIVIRQCALLGSVNVKFWHVKMGVGVYDFSIFGFLAYLDF